MNSFYRIKNNSPSEIAYEKTACDRDLFPPARSGKSDPHRWFRSLRAGQGFWPRGCQARYIIADSGIKGGLIVHLGCGDGKRIETLKLDPALVFDSFIAAGGKLYISTLDGKVICVDTGKVMPRSSFVE